MRAGWNPTRRNRNIGTVKQGRGQNNRLVIPKSCPKGREFWEALKAPIAIPVTIGECGLTVLVECPRPDCFYPCSVEDALAVLNAVPQDDLDGLELLIFRQPTRKQRTLSSTWGRFIYYAVPGKYSGSAICIESHDFNERWNWPRSMGPDSRRELDRLKTDGHVIETERRGYTIHRTRESVRNTVLFRTLLHELGHYADWIRSVILPSLETTNDAEEERIDREFDSKPSKDKEDFAHRYATEMATQLREARQIPFPPKLDPQFLSQHNLERAWFTGSPPAAQQAVEPDVE